MISNWKTEPLKYIIENYEFLVLGIVTLIFILVTVFISGKMIYQGIKNNNSSISYVGVVFFGIASLWFGVALNFLSVLILNTIPSLELYFIMHGGFVAFVIPFGIAAITELLVYKDRTRKLLILISLIFAGIMELIYLTIIFTEIELLGTLKAPIQVEYGIFSYVYLSILLVIFLFFGGNFIRESLNSLEPVVKLKGKLLLASLIIFTFGCILEVFFEDIWIFVVARILMMISAISFYMGFLMPKRVENALLK